MTNPADIEIINEYHQDNGSSYCRICGTWDNTSFRERSCMTLCNFCHEDTPEKCSREEFAAATGINPKDFCFESFWDDYRHSSYGDPKKYWEACRA